MLTLTVEYLAVMIHEGPQNVLSRVAEQNVFEGEDHAYDRKLTVELRSKLSDCLMFFLHH